MDEATYLAAFAGAFLPAVANTRVSEVTSLAVFADSLHVPFPPLSIAEVPQRNGGLLPFLMDLSLPAEREPSREEYLGRL